MKKTNARGRCDTKIKQCFCITDTERVKPLTSQSITKTCKNIDSLRDCFNLIKQCGHSTEMQEAIGFIYLFTTVCKLECPGTFQCFTDYAELLSSSSDISDFSANYEKICRDTTFFQCLSENTKACSSSLSNKWQQVDRSLQTLCSAPVKMWDDFSNCSSLQRCSYDAVVTKNIIAEDINDESVILANPAAVMDAFVNPGWWCSYLTHAAGCVILEADKCSLNATEKEQAVTLKATLDGLCEDTDARQNCTLLLHACNSSLKSDAQFGVQTRQSIQLVQCHVIQSVETTCSSFEKLQSCVNNTLLPNYCEDDPVISSQISNLRQSYSDPCSKDTMCAIELVKCACTADILHSASMCKSIDIYKNCAGKIKDCDKSTQVWQSLSITFKMSEGACKTECPSAFTCWMYAEDQVDFLFGRLHSAVEIFKSQTCRSLATQFQCLVKNTSSCSSSLSLQWQRVEKSYEAVCSIFQPNTTNTSSCASLRTCVYKAQLVSEVSLDDLKSMGVVLIHAADVGEAILDPRTWCRVLIHTMECMEQEADNCLLTTAMKAKVAAANATVRGLCKAKAKERLSSFAVSGYGLIR
ncbi:uncharacterized protein LOC112559726 isoform X2 [Pomacea canaliculata]|uniref:uncharacterized protein LOC112559726 isoform X2 n=1 Tax=Pomacea canaliculata TaxID=400727 RepID=UPI000D72F170|nr:uncharacterized protein LOC112559726 isoform X2 [Pomacea canaliculata]